MNQSSVHKYLPEPLLNSAVIYLVVTDTSGHCLYANSLFKERFPGMTEDLPGIFFGDLICSEDRSVYTDALDTCRQMPGQPVSMTVRCQGNQGQKMRCEVCLVKNAGDSAEGVVHMGHDESSASNGSYPGLSLTDMYFGDNSEKIRTLVNHIPGAIYRCRGDKDITLEFFSGGVERLTGYPVSYFLQNRTNGYSNLVYEADREIFLQNDRHLLMEKEKFEIEYRIVRKDGEIRWVFESGKVHYSQGEEGIFIDGYIFDITGRKEMEAHLKKSEDEIRRLALVAHNTTNSVMVTDAEENIIWINEGYTRISGYTLEEIKGKKIGYSLLNEGGNPAAYQKIRSFLDRKSPYKEEFISYTRNGNPIWLEVDCHPLKDENGKHLGFMAVENDITQRKQTLKEQEELVQRLTLATDSAEIGIFEIDLATNDVIWDDKMYEIYGCTKEPGLDLYKIFFESVHPDDSGMMSNIINELLSQKKEINGAVYRIIVPGGDTRYIESHAIIKKSGSGGILSLIGTNRDVTTDVLIQEKIKSQNKVLRDIAFIQSHEVRRPLANILGVIEILQQSGSLNGLEIFDYLIESAKELDQQIRTIVNKANDMDDEVFR